MTQWNPKSCAFISIDSIGHFNELFHTWDFQLVVLIHPRHIIFTYRFACEIGSCIMITYHTKLIKQFQFRILSNKWCFNRSQLSIVVWKIIGFCINLKYQFWNDLSVNLRANMQWFVYFNPKWVIDTRKM